MNYIIWLTQSAFTPPYEYFFIGNNPYKIFTHQTTESVNCFFIENPIKDYLLQYNFIWFTPEVQNRQSSFKQCDYDYKLVYNN